MSRILAFIVPGVIIGGQIGPRLQGLATQRQMERAVGMLFAVLRMSMLAVVLLGSADGH